MAAKIGFKEQELCVGCIVIAHELSGSLTGTGFLLNGPFMEIFLCILYLHELL